ncbi:MAG: tRNA pseudouridine38-40 synthase [Saprospiraceae bacterium]|jgi:tRNA pseudouridine38-40 synthase
MKFLRYFFEIAYDGTEYSGWQRQPNAMTVQEKIELSLTKLLSSEYISIMGCGRTDAGVHASKYYFHTDLDTEMDMASLKYKLNHVLPSDISILNIIATGQKAHARYDAFSRSYIYNLHLNKDPFREKYSTYYKQARNINFELLESTAAMLLKHEDFAALCKSKSNVKTTICQLTESRWTYNEAQNSYAYHVTSNRFLRGMVRLIVGSSVQIATGKLTLETLEKALEIGEKPYLVFSAPPQGLFLREVKYPFSLETDIKL